MAAAQAVPVGKPESVGLSSERLQRIATVVQRDIDQKRIAGAVTLVARHGRIAWLKAQGMMDREAGKPMQTDSIFRICSMTKPITSLAVMMLY
jgi:CubicO group peptidase (beta-lactamase class C family)